MHRKANLPGKGNLIGHIIVLSGQWYGYFHVVFTMIAY